METIKKMTGTQETLLATMIPIATGAKMPVAIPTPTPTAAAPNTVTPIPTPRPDTLILDAPEALRRCEANKTHQSMATRESQSEIWEQ